MTPEIVLSAAEAAGFLPTGEFTQLNSYENRVFDLRLEEGSEHSRVIAKFYRPGRWSVEALNEEHQFLFDLKKEEVPVVAPLVLKNKKSVCSIDGMWVSFFPKFIGKMPEEFLGNDLFQVGRRLAQIHNIGARSDFKHRPVLGETPHSGWENLELLGKWVWPELWPRYEEAVIHILESLEKTVDPHSFLRIHGDCHRGNLLFRGDQIYFVDFDDCMMGPEVQDIWMLLSGIDEPEEREKILSGYEELRDFPREQMTWIPQLRGLRILNYAAWIIRRWKDPSFPKIFPNFNTFTYWAEETEALEQISWKLR